MLNALPAPLHRALYRLAHALRRLWWRLRRPVVNGVRVIALDPQGRVLLVRHAYGSDAWMPPSGALASHEDPVSAAVRELAEETGCRLVNARLVAQIEEDLRGARNRVRVVAGLAEGEPVPDRREITAARHFGPHELAGHVAAETAERLLQWAADFRDRVRG